MRRAWLPVRHDSSCSYARRGEVLLVAHDRQEVEIHRRDGDGWTVERFGCDQTATVRSLGVELDIANLFVDPLAERAS